MGSWREAGNRESGIGNRNSHPPDSDDDPADQARRFSDSRFPIPDSRLVEVVAGVITDARGRILLARRTRGRDLAGLWEFPGGKLEPGETPEAALIRELHEELGIRAEIGAPLIAVPQQYPHKRLRLDVRHVASWRGGTPKGLDGQALAWVPPQKLASYAMPPADRPVVAALLQPDAYLVTPAPGADDKAWLDALQRALDAGIRRVHLRAPGIDAGRWRQLCAKATVLCRKARASVLINGEVTLASELQAGVHLRAAQLRTLRERPLPAGLPVAASCHDADELRMAERLQCDFAVVGPLRPTPTHADASGIGWPAFAALREQVSLPLYAIGGLDPRDHAEARRHGGQGIAAIRGLWPPFR
jgi:8-oxo-dGTP diphosphatase